METQTILSLGGILFALVASLFAAWILIQRNDARNDQRLISLEKRMSIVENAAIETNRLMVKMEHLENRMSKHDSLAEKNIDAINQLKIAVESLNMTIEHFSSEINKRFNNQ